MTFLFKEVATAAAAELKEPILVQLRLDMVPVLEAQPMVDPIPAPAMV